MCKTVTGVQFEMFKEAKTMNIKLGSVNFELVLLICSSI